MSSSVFTIGHSTHPYEHFLQLLRASRVTAIADVRSSPYSRFYPQFNKEELKQELRLDKISYVFLGDELGGRPKDASLFSDHVADYEKMARLPSFRNGIARVIDGSRKYNVALMCSEHDPKECHRCLLVGRALTEEGVDVRHILSNGKIADQREIESQLIEDMAHTTPDLFAANKNRLSAAYRAQAKRVAYVEQPKKVVSKDDKPNLPAASGRHR